MGFLATIYPIKASRKIVMLNNLKSSGGFMLDSVVLVVVVPSQSVIDATYISYIIALVICACKPCLPFFISSSLSS